MNELNEEKLMKPIINACTQATNHGGGGGDLRQALVLHPWSHSVNTVYKQSYFIEALVAKYNVMLKTVL